MPAKFTFILSLCRIYKPKPAHRKQDIDKLREENQMNILNIKELFHLGSANFFPMDPCTYKCDKIFNKKINVFIPI